MAEFKLYTLEEIHEWLLAVFAGWFPADDFSPTSDNWKRLRVLAMAAAGDQAHLKTLYDDLLPDSATGARQDRWGAILKTPRLQASVSKKAAALRCYGTPGSIAAAGTELTHVDGTRFKVAVNATVPGGGTYVDADIESIDKGSITRKAKGEKLTFTTPPSGFESVAELQKDLDEGGADREEDGDYAVRLLAKIAQPGMGGNPNDYAAWAQAGGAAQAFVYRARGGLGSVHVAAFRAAGNGAARALSGAERTALKAYMDPLIPVSVADFVLLETLAESVDVEARIIPEDGAENAFDWNDVAAPKTVSAYNASTRVLTFSGGARPSDLVVGDRLTWKSTIAPFHDGSEVEVEALGPGAADVTLRAPRAGEYDWTATPPVVGNSIYSGGPLVQPARAAVITHVNSLGPSRGTHAATSWVGTLFTARLFALIQTTAGVLDTLLDEPAANVEATNSPPAPTIGYLVPRRVIMRQA